MRIRPSILTAVALTLALLTTACSSDDADSPESSEVAADDDAANAAADGDAADDAAADGDAADDDTADDAPDATADDDAAADDTADEPASDDGDSADTQQEPESITGAGTVTVDGTDYAISEVRRCEPLDDGTVERELELQGIGEAPGGERVQMDVYVQTIGGAPFDDVAWSGPEGIYGGPDDAEVGDTGEQVSGTATLVDAMTQEDTLSVAFDLPVPSELLACR